MMDRWEYDAASYRRMKDACDALIERYREHRADYIFCEAHDELVRIAREHGFKHRPAFLSGGPYVSVFMVDGEDAPSFTVRT